jgi:hypothetical protein
MQSRVTAFKEIIMSAISIFSRQCNSFRVKVQQAKSRAEEGWMLTEGMGSILLYLIMISAAIGLLFALFSSSKLSQMQQGLSSMTMQVQSLYAGASSYTGLTNAIAIKGGAVPRKLIKGNAIQTPWGGALTLAPGKDTTTFTIKLASVGQDDCAKMAAYQLDMWVNVDVNGTLFDSSSGVSAAVTACTDKSTITYTGR